MKLSIFQIRFWQLVWVKTLLNLKSEASKSYLNYAWWILEPALFITIYYVVFGIFLNQGTGNFVAFLICGKIPFLWFSRTATNGANALISGSGLMNQINIPKLFFPIIVILQDFIKTSVVFVLMISVVIALGNSPTEQWWSLLIVVFIQFIFVSGIAIGFSAIVPILPDFKYIVSTFTILMMFASGVFFDPAQFLLSEHKELFFMNPLASLIEAYRTILLEGLLPDWGSLAQTFAISSGFLIISIIIVSKFDKSYPRLVLQ